VSATAAPLARPTSLIPKWDATLCRHVLIDRPGEDNSRRKDPTITICNSQRWRASAPLREAAYRRARAAALARPLQLLDVLARLDALDCKSDEFDAAVQDLHTRARASTDGAYAAAVAASACTRAELALDKGGAEISINSACFPGTCHDLFPKLVQVLTRPPPAGEVNSDSLAYMLLKATPYRCWTRKFASTLRERFEGGAYRNANKPTQSEITRMFDAMQTRKIVYRVILCGLLGNYPHCKPSSRPLSRQLRQRLVAAFDTKAEGASSAISLTIVRGIMTRAPNLIKMLLREHMVYLIDSGDDPFIQKVALSRMNYELFRRLTIETMDALRVSVGEWVMQCEKVDGEALFANIKQLPCLRERYSCSYKKPYDPPLVALTAHIGLFAEEKRKLEEGLSDEDDEDDDDAASAADLDAAHLDNDSGESKKGYSEGDLVRMLQSIDSSGKGAAAEDGGSGGEDATTGLNVEHCRRLWQYVCLLPTDMTQEELCLEHLPTILKLCGTPAPCIARINSTVRAYLLADNPDGKRPTKALRTQQTTALRSAYPYTMRILYALRVMWYRHSIRKVPMGRWVAKQQEFALRTRFDFTTPAMAMETACFNYCIACGQIYSIVHRQRSNNKQVYRHGWADALLNISDFRMYCRKRRTFGHLSCREQPLVQIPVLGTELRWFNGEAIAICPQPGCGQFFEIDPEHCIDTEHGPACNECTMRLIDEQLSTVARSVLDRYLAEPIKCQFPGCSAEVKDPRHMVQYGSLILCAKKKHKHGKLLSWLKRHLSPQVLRQAARPENAAKLYDSMYMYRRRMQDAERFKNNKNNKAFKVREARARQSRR
jgi:hypothetical protein